MSNGNGVHWHCPNRDCNWSLVATMAEEEGAVPRCVCGSSMKKVELMPVFQYLDFLRVEPPIQEEVRSEKE